MQDFQRSTVTRCFKTGPDRPEARPVYRSYFPDNNRRGYRWPDKPERRSRLRSLFPREWPSGVSAAEDEPTERFERVLSVRDGFSLWILLQVPLSRYLQSVDTVNIDIGSSLQVLAK